MTNVARGTQGQDGDRPTEAIQMAAQTIPTTNSCTIGAHKWTTQRSDEGDRYELCLSCGRRASWVPLWAND